MSTLPSDAELRRELKNRGVDVGPITETTRGLYQKKLRLLVAKERISKSQGCPKKSTASGLPKSVVCGKRRRVPAKVIKNEDVNVNKIRRLNSDVSFPTSKRRAKNSNLYPDLSEFMSPHKSSFKDNELPMISSSARTNSRLQPLSSEGIEVPHQNGKDEVNYSHSSNSPAVSSIDSCVGRGEYPSSSLSTPSPHPSPSSSESSLDYPGSPVSSPSKSGFFQIVTKFIGSHVNKLFNKVEPRPPLSRRESYEENRNHHGDSPMSSPVLVKAKRRSREQPPLIANGNSSGTPKSPLVDPGSINLAAIKEMDLEEEALKYSDDQPDNKTYDWELDASDVDLCKKPDGSLWRLGTGGFGDVFKGTRDGIDQVAVKVIRLHSCSPSVVTQFKMEIDLISKLRHRHILQFYGACIQPKNLYMVTELMDNDLFSMLRLPLEAERYRWNGIYGREVLLGVAAGLNYLHSRKPPVVHRDVKSPNILVMGGLAKIADVGIARTMGTSDMTAQKGYTIAWAAPEVIYRRRATEKIDIWSLGIIIWEVVTGKLPRSGKLVLSVHLPQSLKSLYSQCISNDPEKRPSALEVITELRNVQD